MVAWPGGRRGTCPFVAVVGEQLAVVGGSRGAQTHPTNASALPAVDSDSPLLFVIFKILLCRLFLATLVALHFTPSVSK